MGVEKFCSRRARNPQKLEGVQESDRPMALALDRDPLTELGCGNFGSDFRNLVRRQIPPFSVEIRRRLPANRVALRFPVVVVQKQGEAESAKEAEAFGQRKSNPMSAERSSTYSL
jgi:hypothetical protein